MKLHFLTTHDDGHIDTRHFATREELETAVKDILRRELGPDAYRALLDQDLTETPIWNGPEDDLAALRHLFEEQMGGKGIDLTWGEVEVPAGDQESELFAAADSLLGDGTCGNVGDHAEGCILVDMRHLARLRSALERRPPTRPARNRPPPSAPPPTSSPPSPPCPRPSSARWPATSPAAGGRTTTARSTPTNNSTATTSTS